MYSMIEELIANELETAIKLSDAQKDEMNIVKDIEQTEIEMHIREILNLMLSILLTPQQSKSFCELQF